MKFFSHPEIPLECHLKIVADEAGRLMDHPAIREQKRLGTLARLIGFSHDFGKYTSFFQDYLRGKRTQGKLTRHSLISAFFSAHLAKKFLPYWEEAPLFAYLAVHRHHGHLRIPNQTFPQEIDWEILHTQWKDLVARKGQIRSSLQKVLPEADNGFLDHPFSYLEHLSLDLKRQYLRIERSIPRSDLNPQEMGASHGRRALHLQLLFSVLISADKFSAAGLTRPRREKLSPDLVDAYLQKVKSQKSNNILGTLRDQLQQSVWRNAETVPLPGIFTLSAPTGSGKTLTSLRTAFLWRKRLSEKWRVPPRVVYALPYINLIEQVEETIRAVLENHPSYRNSPERLLIAHHHLADVRYREENEEKPLADALLLVEDWESEVIVTTFVQVFHTLFGYENKFLKKLHNLAGGILVLDEPQQFPANYWKALGWVMSLLHEEMGVTILLMTATQPKILSLSSTKFHELVPKEYPAQFYQKSRRVWIEEIKESELFWERVEEGVKKKKRQLVIVNTIRTSLEIWDRLSKNYSERLNDIPRFYLSTNITPFDRKARIQQIQNHLKENKPLIVISTQVIEAGVDLDFDVVFREISPLDALLQAAGRCNREGKKRKGKTYWFTLKESLLRGSRIYGRVSLDVSREVWPGVRITDADLYVRLKDYFERLTQRISLLQAAELWETYCRLSFSDQTGFLKSLQNYPLIAQKADVPVLVMLFREDEEHLDRFFNEVLKERDLRKRQEAFLRHRMWWYERTLKILEPRILQNPPPVWEDTRYRWIPHDDLKIYYDKQTGFRWREEDLKEEVWVV